MKTAALVIGKFDLLHPEHLHMIKAALHRVGPDGIVAVLFGGAGQLPSLGLACTYEQRLEVLQNSLTPEEFGQIRPFGVRDFGSDAEWRDCVVANMDSILTAEGLVASEVSIVIVVARKDSSSSYVDIFPEYSVEEIPVRRTDIHASDNRIAWLKGTLGDRDDSQVLPAARIMYEQLAGTWLEYLRLKEDLEYSERRSACNQPTPRREIIILAHTADHVVVCSHRTAPYRDHLSLPSYEATAEDMGDLLQYGVLKPWNPWETLNNLGHIRTVSKSAYGKREACVRKIVCDSVDTLHTVVKWLEQRMNGDTLPQRFDFQYMPISELSTNRFDFIEDHPFIIEESLLGGTKDCSH